MEEPAIWVVGSTMVDMIAYADRVPCAGETIAGTSFSLGFGGKGANQAVMARRLGAEVGMVNCLGADVFGDMTVDNFRREGIDVTRVTRTGDASSGVAPIWVEQGGTNRIICVAGANDLMAPEEAADAILSAARVDVVVGQLEIPQPVTRAGFDAAGERGAIRILNPAPAARLEPGLVAASDWIVPNESELVAIGRDVLGRDLSPFDPADIAALAAGLDARLVVTLGERGAALCSVGGEVVTVAAPQVTALDTTGAGDAFVGAFAYGLGRGLSELASVRLGCACAAASVTAPGTQSSFPRGDAIEPLWRWVSAAGEDAAALPAH